MKKIRIKKLPNKRHGGQNGGASDGLRRFLDGKRIHDHGLNQFSEPDFEVNKTIKSVPEKDANIEAEGGETVIVPGEGGIPEHYKIEGPRHSNGGVNLNLDEDSFIFSDNKKGMKIKDKDILKEFNMSVPKKGKAKGKTPADIAKKYDINEYKKTLMDPNSDPLAKETAEKMIENYNMKLGKLALVQESMKGFPQGLPEVANPYLMSITPKEEEGQTSHQGQAAYGTGVVGDPSQYSYMYGGDVNKYQAKRFPGLDIAKNGGTKFGGAFWDSILQDGGEVELPMFQAGGEPDSGVSVTEAGPGEIPEMYKDPKYDSGHPSFDAEGLKVGDYVKTKDGRWKRVTYVPEVVTYEGEDFGTAFNQDRDIANSYAFLERSFNDPEVKARFAEKTKAALRNKEYYKGKSGKYSDMYTEDEINNLSPDDIVNHFLEGQKRNYALQAHGIDPKDFKDSDGSLRSDLSPELKKKYKDMGVSSLNQGFEKAGVPITQDDIQAGDIGIQQGTYWGYHDLLKERDQLSPEMQEKLKYFHEPQEGFSDEPLNKTISPIDSKSKNFWTNTSAGELAVIKQGEIDFEDVETPEESPKPDEPIKPKKKEFVRQQPRDEWWAQDIGNMANLFGQRMGLKKYMPHSFPVDLARPDVLYYDPSRALAANAEQANIAAQATSAFAGPQATYRLSKIQGDAFANAANTLGEYENRNVSVGNQYLQRVERADNQETLANAERLQRLYDQNTIANQQFDNAKRQADRNLFEAWRQGLTNKKMTQALNALYPQFETRPGIGGGLYFTGTPRPLANSGTNPVGGNQYLDQFSELKRKYPTASDSAIRRQLELQSGRNTSQPLDPYERDKRAFLDAYRGIGASAGAYPPGYAQ